MVEIHTMKDNSSTVGDTVGVSSSAGAVPQLTMLCEQLLRAQPQSEALLNRLLRRLHARNQSPFAPIQEGRCSACNMAVATARLQRAKGGEFINCANCITFLYYQPAPARR